MDKTITSIEIVSGTKKTITTVNDEINKMLKGGYQPYGSIVVTETKDGILFTQVMVRYKED